MMEPDQKMVDEGWSFIELWGGPYDGWFKYFKGTVNWEIALPDPGVPEGQYKKGDLAHLYRLSEGEGGIAVYQWIKQFREG